MEKKEIESILTDVILGRSYSFTAGEERFYLYPLTLGMSFLSQRILKELEIDYTKDANLETLRVAEEKKDACLTLIAYRTSKPSEVFDFDVISKKKAYFEQNLDQSDIASLLIIILTSDKTDILFEELGIAQEQKRISEVLRIKNDKNSISFGGQTIFGTLIDTACERYGWTKDYVVWGIDYSSLRLMLADKIVDIYLTDEERKKLPSRATKEEAIKATKENMGKIKSMDWK